MESLALPRAGHSRDEAETDALGVRAASAILMDASSGAVLYERSPDAPRSPASVTKILTALVILDITESKRIEEALVQSEKKYRLLAENITDVIWTTDMNLDVTYVSPSAERGIGFTVKKPFYVMQKSI